MKAFKFLLMGSLLLLNLHAFSQSNSFKCDIDRFKNCHNDNSEFNDLIDNACKEINLGNYSHATKLLADALKSDSLASNGNMNAYVESQLRKLKRFISESAATTPIDTKENTSETINSTPTNTETKAEVKKEEVKSAPVEPVKKAEPETVVTKEETSPIVPEPSPKKEEITETNARATPTVVTSTEKKEEPVTKIDETPSSAVSSPTNETNAIAPEVVEKKFSPEMLEEFHNKGMQKVRQLETFVYQIGSKSSPANMAMTSIDNALKLFDSEDRTVQVSSATSGSKNKYKIRIYLQRLRNLNYSDVKIEWADFQYASDFIKGSDGNYHGYIVFQQRFSATMENMKTYTDITTKKIEVILKSYEKAQQGEHTENWDVLLGDISVVQTEKN